MNVFKNSVLILIGLSITSLPVSAKPVAPENMVANCRGEAAGYFGTGAQYIEMEKLVRNQDGSYSVKGTANLGDADKKSFQCNYNKNGNFKGVVS
jgi:hypothetical protein